MTYVHLHRHSEYSRLDGVGTAKQYADRAAELGQPALAQTDHGTLSGALHHIQACREASIVPISGVEAYFRPDRAKAKAEKNQKAWHLCLFAKNLRGWHTLLRLVSAAYGEVEDGGGFYQYPAVDWELLERHHEGLVCSTACINSWLANLIDLGHDPEVRSYIERMRKIFRDDLWIEIMPHDFDDQRVLNLELISIADEYSIPIVATNDAHFPYKEWADTQRIVKMLNSNSSFKKAEEDVKKGKADYLSDINPTLYLADEEEMYYWFQTNHPDIPYERVQESIENTVAFVDTIKPFLLDKAMKLPRVTDSPRESARILQDWIKEGLKKLELIWLNEDGLSPDDVDDRLATYRERIEYEWGILESKGVLDYFVMVGEIVRWCATEDPLPPVEKGERDNFPMHRAKWFKKKPIRVGLGRGSAAGCLISYLIGIVQIDPIAYNLLFERFLNPNRKGLPDIDLDFQSDGRALVKEFISRRYGRTHVADIITHQRFQPKKVIGDLGRVFDRPYNEIKRVTDTIEIKQDDEETTLEELVPINDRLAEFKKNEPELWKQALRLEGTVANAGKHAAGVIITPEPITQYMALERGKSGDLVTSWSDAADFQVISDYGFVKLDALGIAGLQRHDYACKLIEERTGEIVDLYALPALRDPYAVDDRVMQGFRDGHTKQVFQFGSRGITKLLKEIKPDNILDLASANALYRPGPMKGGTTWNFPKAKNNVFLRSYVHEDLREWLEETYGIIAYQEQVMLIAGGIGRLSAGDTDDMRKAMGKLYRIKGGTAAKDFMRKFEEPFFDGAMKDHGWTREEAEEVWNLFLEFGHYGFNKSHSCSYALQAYQDMYLKILYPYEFYAAALTYEEDSDKIKEVVREARALGVELRPPDINMSGEGYTTDGESLMLGLTAIKGVGSANAKTVIANRPYEDADKFFATKGIPHRELIESGSCDSFLNRNYMLSFIKKQKRDGTEEEWQVWEHLKHNAKLKKPREVPKFRREPAQEMVDALWEQSFTVPMKRSGLDESICEYMRENCHLGEEFRDLEDGERAICGGEIIKVEFKTTVKGSDYARIRVAFESDEWACTLWEPTMLRNRHMLVEGFEVMVAGKKDSWNGFESIVVEDMTTIEDFFAEDDEEETNEPSESRQLR